MPTGKRRGSIGQADITESMRAILVDWLVEVQESFELNHETLYTAVKLMDLYLSKVRPLLRNIRVGTWRIIMIESRERSIVLHICLFIGIRNERGPTVSWRNCLSHSLQNR